jgi:hypothetical protein
MQQIADSARRVGAPLADVSVCRLSSSARKTYSAAPGYVSVSSEFNGRGEADNNVRISILNQEKSVIEGLAGSVSSTDAARLQRRMQDVDSEIARRQQNSRDLHQFARDTGDTRGLEP